VKCNDQLNVSEFNHVIDSVFPTTSEYDSDIKLRCDNSNVLCRRNFPLVGII
jgi:hypothetical protein